MPKKHSGKRRKIGPPDWVKAKPRRPMYAWGHILQLNPADEDEFRGEGRSIWISGLCYVAVTRDSTTPYEFMADVRSELKDEIVATATTGFTLQPGADTYMNLDTLHLRARRGYYRLILTLSSRARTGGPDWTQEDQWVFHYTVK